MEKFGRLKKLFVLFSIALVMLCGASLFGCKNDDNMQLTLSKTNVEIILGEDDNTDYVYALVSNAKTLDVTISYDSLDIVVTKTNEGNGLTKIKIIALRQCSNVEVKVKGAKNSQTFKVTARSPISSIIPKQESYALGYDSEKGGSYTLSNNLVNLLPEGTSQTELTYKLTNDMVGVSIVGNTLKIEPNLDEIPQRIDVEVISVSDNTIKTTIHFDVVKTLDISKITIEEENGVDAKLSYNIPRNNPNASKNSLTLVVVVPSSVADSKLNVKEVFAYGDLGLVVKERKVEKTTRGYEYTFIFGFSSSKSTGVKKDQVWFTLSYIDYPEMSASTAKKVDDDGTNIGVIDITAYDEVTDIACYMNDTLMTTTSLNVYTSYNNSLGVKLRFETLPTNAQNSTLIMHIAQTDADYIIIKDEKGSIQAGNYGNGEITFTFESGKSFYFVANENNFAQNKAISLKLTSQSDISSTPIEKTLTLDIKEGIKQFGFGKTADTLTSEQTYYLENSIRTTLDEDGNQEDYTQSTIVFGISPASINLSNLTIGSNGDVYELSSRPEKLDDISTDAISFYSLTIKAKSKAVGSGIVTLKFESGQEIKANVNVIEQLTTANVDIDLFNFVSSSIGKMARVNDSLSYVAIKNNKMISLKYTTNTQVNDIKYSFVDIDLDTYDVYNTDSPYAKFNDLTSIDTTSMSETSDIINAEILKSNKYISSKGVVGKVWIKFTFVGSKLDSDFQLVESQVDQFVLVEVYDPVEYLNVSNQTIELYAYNDVGEVNSSLTKSSFTVSINSNATYNKVLFARELSSMFSITQEEPLYINSLTTDETALIISQLNDNTYNVEAKLKDQQTYKLYVLAEDINGLTTFVKQITFVIKTAVQVQQIEVTNVNTIDDKQTIYLKTQSLSSNYNDYNFKIVTKATPENALCSDVSYIFYPDSSTSSDIISISSDGIVNVSGEYGGTGTIKIIPRDAILRDENGNVYYRENYPYKEIRIVVSDGKSKETSIRVSRESDIKDNKLHYTIVVDNLTITKTLFEQFYGGLYGKSSTSNIVATISLTNTLFESLEADAIVEDLYINCKIDNGGGTIANANYGTINNVVIDVDASGTNSFISSDGAYVGGFVGKNYGTIKNGTFSGSVKGGVTSIVGAIAGQNLGIIESCEVLFYSLDNNEEMKLEGQTTAALVGEMSDNSKLTKSYAYNFSNNNIGANYGLVGKISSSSARIAECFADLGQTKNMCEDNADIDITKVIKDSYVTYETTDENDEKIYKFSYIMTKRNGSILRGETQNTDAYFDSINFGYNEVWNKDSANSFNRGFPYLNNVKRVIAVTGEELDNIQIKKTSLSFAQSGDKAILMLNKTTQNLSSVDTLLLSQYNTISLLDLFNISSTSGLEIKSSDSNIISLTASSLKVINRGDCTLTISSKYDRSIASKVINIKVIYATNDFTMIYNNTQLVNGTIVGLKLNSTQKFTSYIKDEIALNQTNYNLMLEDYNVRFVDINGDSCGSIVGSKIGAHSVILTGNDDILLNVYLYLDGLDADWQEILKSSTQKGITLHPLKGANSILSSMSSANISASDVLSVTLTIDSDIEDETIACDIYDENWTLVYDSNGYSFAQGSVVTESLFNVNILSNDNNIYNLSIELNKNKLDEVGGSYYMLRFYATSNSSNVYVDVKLNILTQEIIRLDVNNYSFKENVSQGETYNYYPTNTLTNQNPSLLDIMVYPAYASYSYLTVTSSVVNGEKLSLISMRKGSQTGESSSAFYVDNLTNFEFIENGIKIFNNSNSNAEIARFYIRALATSAIKVDTIFNIYINAYDKNGEVVYSYIHSLLISPPVKAGLSIEGKTEVDGKYYALMGEQLTVKMIIEKSQTISSYKLVRKVDNQETSDGIGIVSFNNDYVSIDSKYYQATFTINLDENSLNNFVFQVTTKRTINGKEELTISQLNVYVIPFELNFAKTEVKNGNSGSNIFGDIYFSHTLDFNIGANYTESGEKYYKNFLENYTYSGNNYFINSNLNSKLEVLRTNLYYVNDDGSVSSIYNKETKTYRADYPVEFSESTETDELLFIGNSLGTQKMRFEMRATFPDGTTYVYRFDFTIQIKAELNDDEPVQIYTAQEFLDAFNQADTEHYMLMKDIRLYDYTPITSTQSVASLDGNGFTISLCSFASDVTNFALFENIDADTVVKNVRVNIYNLGLLNIDSSVVTQVNYAPMAINNNGIITNSEVVNLFNGIGVDTKQQTSGILLSTDYAAGIEAKTAGFVLNNNGTITNSRVGVNSTTYTTYKANSNGTVTEKSYSGEFLPQFNINSFGDIAGFVYENTGHITSSFVSNVRIINSSDIDYTTITSGFVVKNSGTISMSYTKGIKASTSDIHATRYGIETSGIASGFVYENSSSISDCYSNINLTNTQNNPGRTSSGFVYKNLEGAKISNSLSLSRIINATTTQRNFSGVDELGNYMCASDTIENCYYYDQEAIDSDDIIIQDAYGENATSISSVIMEAYFYGFNFSKNDNDDGIWVMTGIGPELVSANDIATSIRYMSEKSANLEKPKTSYVNDFRYGSKSNPILIKDATTFNEAFSGTANKSVDNYVNIESNTIFGNYRLIDNIDLHDLASETETYTLNSSTKTLSGNFTSDASGKFDGNGFEITNLSITNSGEDKNLLSYGMFSEITGGAIVENVNIVLGDQNNEKEIFGIEAKNIPNVGTLAGKVEDSKIVNVNVSALQKADTVTVRGKNAVGGIAGLVKGESYIINSKVQDINVTAAYYPANVQGTSYSDYNEYSRWYDTENLSYAGGVVGILDYYTEATKNTETFQDKISITDATMVLVKNIGTSVIEGGTVGGIAGYTGNLTTLQDVQYMPYTKTVSDYEKQGLYSYNGFAGGIAGLNKGYLRQVRSEHDDVNIFYEEDGLSLTLQQLIELNSLSYYYTSQNITGESGESNGTETAYERGNLQLFYKENYSPIAIGGLVGLQCGGKIEKSYSKINVRASNAKIAGGIVGIVAAISDVSGDNSEEVTQARLSEVYASGDVYAKEISSGIIGKDFNTTSGKITVLEKVNAVNMWSKDSNGTSSTFCYISSSETVDMTMSSVYYLKTNDGIRASGEAVEWSRVSKSQDNVKELYKQGYDFGEDYDNIFFAKGWDTNFWQRDDDELYPHMIFGYFDKTIRIQTQKDLEKLRYTSTSNTGKVTYILDPIDNGENIYDDTSKIRLITVNKYISPIIGFASILRGGEDPNIEYGFNFTVSQRPLFETTLNGAIFKDFSVYFDYKSKNTTQATSISQTSGFVRTANSTTFSNLTFNNITINAKASGTLKAGIVCAVAKGTCSFEKIELKNCSINFSSPTIASVGLLFGEGNLSTSASVIDVTLDEGAAISGSKISGSDNKQSFIGLVAGKLDNFNSIKINIKTSKLSISIKDTLNSAILGSLIGSLKSQNQSSSFSVSAEKFSPTLAINGCTKSIIGGVVGQANCVSIKELSFTPDVDICTNTTTIEPDGIQSTTNACDFDNSTFGGIIGYAEKCSLKVIQLGSYTYDNDGVKKQGEIEISNVQGNCYIGSFVGQMDGGSADKITSFASLSINLKKNIVGEKDNIPKLYIGGFAGAISGTTLGNQGVLIMNGDIAVTQTSKIENYDVYIANVVAQAKNSELYNCYTTGDIMYSVGQSNPINENVNLYTSGIVAYVGENVKVSNNISCGNVYPTYYNGTKSFNVSKLGGTSYIFTQFVYGGIIGTIQADTVAFNNNISINTLFNELDEKLTSGADSYYANALVGNNNEKIGEQSDNKYAHVYTLTTDSMGENVSLGSVLGKIQEKLGSQSTDESTKSLYNNFFKSGSKVNPQTNVGDENENKYIFLDEDEKAEKESLTKSINLTNTFLVSDGKQIKVSSNDVSTPFGKIDENSIVSGVVTCVTISVSGEGAEASGFALNNEGIIYSSNAVGGRNDEEPIRGLVKSTQFAAGFVNNNSGLVKNCFTYLDVISPYVGSSDTVTVAGFARFNSGYIVSSYTTGEVSNIADDDNKTCKGKMYLFAPGYVSSSYSIARMVDKSLDDTNRQLVSRRFAFEKDKADEACFYDKYACEAKLYDETLGNKTDEISIDYDATENDKKSDSKTESSDFYRNVEYSFGYDSFISGAYENIAYMHFYTGNGTSVAPFKIPNLGKLQLIERAEADTNKETIYFRLDNNINAEYISGTINWEALDLEKINFDGSKYDYGSNNNASGKNYEIKNLTSDIYGLFNEITASTIQNIDLDNIVIDSALSAKVIGLFANNIESSIIKNINLNIDASNLNNTLEDVDNDCTIGLLIGKVTSGTLSSSKVTVDYSGDDTSLKISNKYNWIIGGVVGEQEGGTIKSVELTGTTATGQQTFPTFSVQFNNDKSTIYQENKKFVIGGIVGKQIGGLLSAVGLKCNISAFTNNDTQIGENLTLKLGGIVGESTVTSMKDNEGNSQGIQQAFTSDGVVIEGGNHLSFAKSYVAGICGFGGALDQCKNGASVGSYAVYYYKSFRKYEPTIVQENVGTDYLDNADNGFTKNEKGYYEKGDLIATANSDGTYTIYNLTDENGFSYEQSSSTTNGFGRSDKLPSESLSEFEEYYNCYEKSGWFGRYSKILYTRINQEAHAGGLANSYNHISNSLNTSDDIVGGMDSKNIHSEYFLNEGSLHALAWTTAGIIVGCDVVYDKCILIPTWGWIVAGAALATSVGAAIAASLVPFDLEERYFPGNGYEYQSDTEHFYYIGSQYNNEDFSQFGSKVIMPAVIKAVPVLISRMISKFSKNILVKCLVNMGKKIGGFTGGVVAVAPFALDMAATVIPNFTTLDPWCVPIGQIQTSDAGILTKDYLENCVTDNYGIYKETMSDEEYYYTKNDNNHLNIYNIYFDSIGLPANNGTKNNVYSTYQVYDTVTIDNVDYYGINDNSVVYDSATGVKNSVYKHYNLLYNVNNTSVTSNLTKSTSESNIDIEGFDGISLDTESPKTSISNLLDNEVTEVGDDEIVININYSTAEDNTSEMMYNKAVEMINHIYDSIEINGYDAENDEYIKSLKESGDESAIDKFVEIVKAVKGGIPYRININTTLNGVQYSLGTSKNPFKGTIQGGYTYKQSEIKNIEVPSLVSYGKNVTVKNLNLEYSNTAKKSSENSFGGVIANASGDCTIYNTTVTFNFKDYIIDAKGNCTPYTNDASSVGGLVGKNSGNLTIEKCDVKDLSLYLLSTGSNINDLGIGGFVGTNFGTLTVSSSNVYDLNIQSQKCANTIYGGALGINSGSFTANKVTVGNSKTSIIDAESSGGTIVGGFVGKLAGESINNFSDIAIMLKGVYANTSNTSNTVYAGGFVGYISDDITINSNTIKLGVEQENKSKKMLVYAGIGGSAYANKAYASDICGNGNNLVDGDAFELNVKSLSFAKPNYTKLPSSQNLGQNREALSNGTIDSTNIISEKNLLFKQSLVNSDMTGFLKIDLHEYKVESHSSEMEAYVNGEKFTTYNYHKSYLLSVITMSKTQVKENLYKTIDYYLFSERFYKVDFTGLPSKDGELDIQANYTISMIAYNEYITNSNIYSNYLQTAYPLSQRYSSYLPNILTTVYSTRNIGIDDFNGMDENTDTNAYTLDEYWTSIKQLDDISQSVYLDSTSRKININFTISTSSYSISGTTVTYDTDSTTNDKYKSIIINDEKELELSYTDSYGNEETPSISTDLSKIYSSEPKGVSEYSKGTQIEIPASSTISKFAIQYIDAEGDVKYSDVGAPLKQTTNKQIIVYEKTLYLNQSTSNLRKVVIISNQTLNTDNNYKEVIDYIFVITADGKVHNMGYICYGNETNGIENIDLTQRTSLFFPSGIDKTTDTATYYINELVSLDKSTVNSRFSIEETIKDIETTYYYAIKDTYNKDDQKLHYITKTTTKIATYTFDIGLNGVSVSNTVTTGETTSSSGTTTSTGIISFIDESNNVKYKYNDLKAVFHAKNESVSDDYDYLKISYCDENSINFKITYTWEFVNGDDNTYKLSSLTRKEDDTSINEYVSTFQNVGNNFSYRISKGNTIFKFGSFESDSMSYTILGEYTVTLNGSNYKFTNKSSDDKIVYFIISSDGTILEIVYKQLEIYVKEDYENNKIYLSKDKGETFDSDGVLYEFVSVNITTFNSKEVSSTTYIKENQEKVTYYSLLTMADATLRSFDKDLNIVQKKISNSDNIVAYLVNNTSNSTLYVYYQGNLIYEKTIQKDVTLTKVSVDSDLNIKYALIVTTDTNNSDIKIDLNNYKVVINDETTYYQEYIKGSNSSVALSFDTSFKYEYIKHLYKYNENKYISVFDISQGNINTQISIDGDVTLSGLLPINKGIFVFKFSHGVYYSIDGKTTYTGTITKNTSLSKIYTALGSLTASFEVWNISLTGEKRTLVIRTSAINNGLANSSNVLTTGETFEYTYNDEEDIDIDTAKEKKYEATQYAKFTNGKMNFETLAIKQKNGDGTYIDVFKINGDETKYTEAALQNDGYEVYEMSNGENTITRSIINEKFVNTFTLYTEQSITISTIERNVSKSASGVITVIDDLNNEVTTIATYIYKVDENNFNKPSVYDAITVVTDSNASDEIGTTYKNGTIPYILGINVFGIDYDFKQI